MKTPLRQSVGDGGESELQGERGQDFMMRTWASGVKGFADGAVAADDEVLYVTVGVSGGVTNLS